MALLPTVVVTVGCGQRNRMISGQSHEDNVDQLDQRSISSLISELEQDDYMMEKVTVDIGGVRFITKRSTLLNVPDTRLSRLALDNKGRSEFFFDRNAFLFGYILDYYRSGELHLPKDRCGKALKNELEFWGLEEASIASCCWTTFTDSIQTVSTNMRIEKEFAGVCLRKYIPCLTDSVKSRIWVFLSYPKSSTWAQMYAVISSIMVVLSLLLVMLGTVPSLRISLGRNNFTESLEDINFTTKIVRMQSLTVPYPVIVQLDFAIAAFFLLEFCVRFFVCPDKSMFLKCFSTFADIIYFTPVLILSISSWVDRNFWIQADRSTAFMVFQALVSLRVLRLYCLASCIRGFNVLILALKASSRELLLLVSLTVFASVVFAFCIFYTEMYVQESFTNAMVGMWWALITMTSVGYGDIYPVGALGCVIGVLCTFVGLILISLPVPMIANNFNQYYAFKERTVCGSSKKSQWQGNNTKPGSNDRKT